jgi:hypothetical protein
VVLPLSYIDNVGKNILNGSKILLMKTKNQAIIMNLQTARKILAYLVQYNTKAVYRIFTECN